MHDAAEVGRVDGTHQDLDHLGGGPHGLGLALQPGREGAAGGELEGQVGPAVPLADLEDLDDVGVVEAGDHLGLGLEVRQVDSRPPGDRS